MGPRSHHGSVTGLGWQPDLLVGAKHQLLLRKAGQRQQPRPLGLWASPTQSIPRPKPQSLS